MTPNIDAIGGQGTRFARAYATCPIERKRQTGLRIGETSSLSDC